MDHYGKSAAQRVLMQRWCAVFQRDGFYQQLNPETGEVSKYPGAPASIPFASYSPAALAYLYFAKRLGHAPMA